MREAVRVARGRDVILHIAKGLGLFAAGRALHRNQVRVLCYHGVWRARDGYRGDAMFIRRETFLARLRLLRDRGFNVISLEQAILGLRNKRPLPPHAVVITIDDGWYSTFAEMLPILKQMKMPATIYCDTDNLLAKLPIPHVMARYLWEIHKDRARDPEKAKTAFKRATTLELSREQRYAAMLELAEYLGINVDRYLADRVFAYMTPEELAEAHRAGFAVELHTHSHSLHDFQPDRIAEEIALNRRALAALLGKPPNSFRHFCYPGGDVAPGVETVLGDLDVVSATTLETGLAGKAVNPLRLPRLTDGDHLSPIMFEAELCGLGSLVRGLRRRAARIPMRWNREVVRWAKARVPRPLRVGEIVRAPCPRGNVTSDDFAHPTNQNDRNLL